MKTIFLALFERDSKISLNYIFLSVAKVAFGFECLTWNPNLEPILPIMVYIFFSLFVEVELFKIQPQNFTIFPAHKMRIIFSIKQNCEEIVYNKNKSELMELSFDANFKLKSALLCVLFIIQHDILAPFCIHLKNVGRKFCLWLERYFSI